MRFPIAQNAIMFRRRLSRVYYKPVMSEIRILKMTPKRRMELLSAEKHRYEEIKAAIDAISRGAVSATVSTAGGTRSFTRASLSDLHSLLRKSARRYRNLLGENEHVRIVRVTPDWSK